MKHAIVFALTLFVISLFGIPAQAQQEVDPTPYPLPRAAQYKPGRPVTPQAVKQTSTHRVRQASANKAQKPASTAANTKDAKLVAKR